MIHTIALQPPNALILLMDSTGGEIPAGMAGGVVAVTATCIAIGTREPSDGETVLEISDAGPDTPEQMNQIFRGKLALPTQNLAVMSVFRESYWTTHVTTKSVSATVWANHSHEPDHIHICISDMT